MYVQHKHIYMYINIVRTHGIAIIGLSNHRDVPTGHKKIRIRTCRDKRNHIKQDCDSTSLN